MKKIKQLGIWMDLSVVYLIDLTTKPFEIQTIIHEFHLADKNATKIEKESSIKNIYSYYNRIANAILKYDKIILFGSSNAKVEFFDVLSEDKRFLKMKIEIKEADSMNVNQQHAFINEYFVP